MNKERKGLIPRPSLYDITKANPVSKDGSKNVEINEEKKSFQHLSVEQKINQLVSDLNKEREKTKELGTTVKKLSESFSELQSLYDRSKEENTDLKETVKYHGTLLEQIQNRLESLELENNKLKRSSLGIESPPSSSATDEYPQEKDILEGKKGKSLKKLQKKKDKLMSSKGKDDYTKDHKMRSESFSSISDADHKPNRKSKIYKLLQFKKKEKSVDSADDKLDDFYKKIERRNSQLEGLSLETRQTFTKKPLENHLVRKRSRSNDLSEKECISLEEKETFEKFIEQYKESQTSPYCSIFGVKRGKCLDCDCKCYKKNSAKVFSCVDCGHFPAQHEDLGRLSDDEDMDEYLSEYAPITPLSPASSSSEINMDIAIDAHWILDYDHFEFVDLLGKGNSSTVYLGTLKNQEVAIKVLRLENQKKEIEDFKKEMEIMSTIRSPYIVHFLGATMSPKPCIVLEYCPNGSLFHYLQNSKNRVDWKMIMQWIFQITKGINTLHLWKPQVVHRDLKTLNLLLDVNNKVKVCDFGLSRFISSQHDQGTLIKMRGTLAYVAPEIYFGKAFTTKSDVYSFGIVLWEIINRIISGKHSRPYGEYNFIRHDFQIIIQAATKDIRPVLPESTPQILRDLYLNCVRSEPEKRPTCMEILTVLEDIKKEYESNMEAWDALVNNPWTQSLNENIVDG